MLRHWIKRLSSTIFVALLLPVALRAEELRVLAPASLGGVSTRLEMLWPDKAHPLRFILGPSSQLVRQLAQGLPAHILITANEDWMQDARKRGLISPQSEATWVENILILASGKPYDSLNTLSDLPMLLNPGTRIALCGPGPVPCGLYAKNALEKLGLWARVEPYLVYAKDAAAARHFVESGVVNFGFLYKSDAIQSNKLSIVLDIDPELAGHIHYKIAMIKASDQHVAQRIRDFLFDTAAQDALRDAGFTKTLPPS